MTVEAAEIIRRDFGADSYSGLWPADLKIGREFTICVLLKRDEILLKQANRGDSNGKWNPPGGTIEKGETKSRTR